MKQIGMTLSAIAWLCSCGTDNTQNKDVIDAPSVEKQAAKTVYEPSINPVKYENLLAILQANNDTLYVVNFWATWCMPCVKELPYFVSTAKAMQGKPMKLILVSLDTKDEIEAKVLPFLKEKQFEATHFLLDDNGRMNEWIPKFDANWDGAIPATALYKNGKKIRFTAGQLSEAELKEQINSNITQR